MKKIPRNCRALSGFGFLDSPLLLRFAFSLHQTYASTYLARHCRVLRLFVSLSLPPDHVYPSSGLSFKKMNLVKPVHASDNFCFSIHVPVIIWIFLQRYVKWCMSISGNVDVLQRKRKWFFLRHVQFDSGFHVMAINEIFRNRPKVIFSFRIIQCWVILMWGWRRESVCFSSKNFLFLSSFGMIPDWGGWFQTSISSRRVDCSICDWVHENFTSHWR